MIFQFKDTPDPADFGRAHTECARPLAASPQGVSIEKRYQIQAG